MRRVRRAVVGGSGGACGWTGQDGGREAGRRLGWAGRLPQPQRAVAAHSDGAREARTHPHTHMYVLDPCGWVSVRLLPMPGVGGGVVGPCQ